MIKWLQWKEQSQAIATQVEREILRYNETLLATSRKEGINSPSCISTCNLSCIVLSNCRMCCNLSCLTSCNITSGSQKHVSRDNKYKVYLLHLWDEVQMFHPARRFYHWSVSALCVVILTRKWMSRNLSPLRTLVPVGSLWCFHRTERVALANTPWLHQTSRLFFQR